MLWITRDKHGYSDYVEIWKGKKPKNNHGTFESDRLPIAEMDITSFKSNFGYTPRKGSIRKVKITVEDAE